MSAANNENQDIPADVPEEVLKRYSKPDIPPIHEKLDESPIKVFWNNLNRLVPSKAVSDEVEGFNNNEDPAQEQDKNNKQTGSPSKANNEQPKDKEQEQEHGEEGPVTTRDVEMEINPDNENNNQGKGQNEAPAATNNDQDKADTTGKSAKPQAENEKQPNGEKGQGDYYERFRNRFWAVFSLLFFIGVIVTCPDKDEKKKGCK